MSRTIIRLVVVLMASMFLISAVRAASGPVVTQLTCVSTVGSATLTDVMPASTQVVTLSSASGDVIRC